MIYFVYMLLFYSKTEKKSMKDKIESSSKKSREVYIGGDPPSGDFTAQSGSTEFLREWARSAAEKPAPIKYHLDSIDKLIREEFFSRLNSGRNFWHYVYSMYEAK